MLKTIFLVAVVILLIVFGPFFGIWALNTLFKVGIPYNMETWAAAIVLHATLRGIYVKKS